VILNIVSNAKDSILEKRRKSADKADESGEITFDFYNRGGRVVIEVKDNGAGISEDILPRIFEPYFTTKEESRGTGIGLYMSKIIIEDHMKGRLTARSGADGAVFMIEMPQTDKGDVL
jgi:signal transduction histidine kinase